MERGSKRKRASSTGPSTAMPHTAMDPSTPQDATRVGLQFMGQLRTAQDKTGRLIATEFLFLPSREDFPDYYQHIVMPLAIDLIEQKCKDGKYSNISEVESDVKRMAQNAKDYNENTSSIFQNAERIRKLTHNFMTKHNPAHKNKDYHPQPTPLPTQQIRIRAVHRSSDVHLHDAPSQVETEERRAKRRKSTPEEHLPSEPAVQKVNSSVNKVPETSSGPFSGKTFQQAQDQIVTELLEAMDEGGDFRIFEPFANLPSRQLQDYYKVIKEPTSLKGVLKKIHGIHGRHENTGTTDFKSWDMLENEVRKIWDNARAYNEDGSEISKLSVELEEHFKKLLGEAKTVVAEPAQPTLKLNMSKPAPLKLRLGSHKASPGPQAETDASPRPPVTTESYARPQSRPGIAVDQSSLERQKQHVEAAVNGVSSPQLQNSDPRAPSRSPSAAGLPPKSIQSAGSPSAAPGGIKAEADKSQSPAPNSSRTQSVAGSMPPPNRLPNGTTSHLPIHQQHPPDPLESRYRQPGKGIADALITNITLNAHPSLNNSNSNGPNITAITKPATELASIPAHPHLTQQSVTMHLPPSHYIVQLALSLSPEFATGRPYRLFVTANGQRLSPTVPSPAGSLTDFAAANMGSAAKQSLFDVKLVPGVNRLEVECVAIAAPTKNGMNGITAGSAAQLEAEKVSVFVNLLRH